MAQVRVIASDELSGVESARLRELLDDAFEQTFTEDDWEHALGGLHAIVTLNREPVAHAAVVARDIEVGRRRFRCGYVEAVATAPAAQGKGYGSQAMSAVTDLVRRGFELGALSTGRHRFYERFGWERWQGPSFVIRGGQRVRTPDEDGGIMVLRFGGSVDIPLTCPIACQSRRGDDW